MGVLDWIGSHDHILRTMVVLNKCSASDVAKFYGKAKGHLDYDINWDFDF